MNENQSNPVTKPIKTLQGPKRLKPNLNLTLTAQNLEPIKRYENKPGIHLKEHADPTEGSEPGVILFFLN